VGDDDEQMYKIDGGLIIISMPAAGPSATSLACRSALNELS
jgi:hypothetical protein